MNISGEAGDMGILANHVPSIEALRPGVVEVIEAAGSKKWFGEPNTVASVSVLTRRSVPVSGGFATVHPNNRLTINAVEAAPLEDFSLEVCSRNPWMDICSEASR